LKEGVDTLNGNSTATLRSLSELEEMKAESIKESVISAFDSLTLVDSDAVVTQRTWLGHVNTEAHSPMYLAARTRLSDAAYWGEWDNVFEMLEHGRKQYQENWVNAFRMSMA
jgi:hypothetical protein